MEQRKPTNPKDALGIGRVPFSPVPAQVTAEVGLAMMEGARKYGRHNYRKAGVKYSIYYDALLRHITAWWEGEDIDPDSGVHHLIKGLACIYVLKDSINIGNAIDDRPPKLKDGWVKRLNKQAEDIIKKYPDTKEPFTQK